MLLLHNAIRTAHLRTLLAMPRSVTQRRAASVVRLLHTRQRGAAGLRPKQHSLLQSAVLLLLMLPRAMQDVLRYNRSADTKPTRNVSSRLKREQSQRGASRLPLRLLHQLMSQRV